MTTMDNFGRPEWDSFYMALAFVASQRSIDPSTKHGCVLVSPHNRIISIGFNGPPRGADDTKVPLTRPEKYPFMAHAEANAIDNADEPIQGATAYVTGVPCSGCLLRLIQRGVAKIVYGRVGSNMVNDKDAAVSKSLLDVMKPGKAPQMVYYECNEFANVLLNTLEYIVDKCGHKTDYLHYMFPTCQCKKAGWLRWLWRKTCG